jgi:hypothetical protein
VGGGEASFIFVDGLSDQVPSSPLNVTASVVSGTSVRVDWDKPQSDGGESIESYTVGYDTCSDFSCSGLLNLHAVHELQIFAIEADNVDVEVQTITATVDVVNEVQTVSTSIGGIDEIQTITLTCDDVVAEVQTVTTSAVEIDEIQELVLDRTDNDKIQLVRVYGDDIPEIQEVSVTVTRQNEVQQLGILISKINTDGDNINSFACVGDIRRKLPRN